MSKKDQSDQTPHKTFSGNYGCKNCDFTGWVCEKHPDRPYKGASKREDACGCSSGTVCWKCRWESDTPEPPPRKPPPPDAAAKGPRD